MITPALWLSLINFNQEIGNVPVTFSVDDHLSVFIRKYVSGWLTELIGESTVKAISDELAAVTGPIVISDLTQSTQDWLALILPFLANASWSDYILHGNVNITETGPVSKNDQYTDAISDRQRTELKNYYRSEAEGYAQKLSAKASAGDSCGNTLHSSRTSIKTVKGVRRSRFDNYHDRKRRCC